MPRMSHLSLLTGLSGHMLRGGEWCWRKCGPLKSKNVPALLLGSLSPCLSKRQLTNSNINEFKREGHWLTRNIVWAEPKNWWGLGILRDLLHLWMGGGSFFWPHSPPQFLRPQKMPLIQNLTLAPFDTCAFEGPGRESSLFVVRINSLYTQTINSSMDLPAPWKSRPDFPGPLGLYSVP